MEFILIVVSLHFASFVTMLTSLTQPSVTASASIADTRQEINLELHHLGHIQILDLLPLLRNN